MVVSFNIESSRFTMLQHVTGFLSFSGLTSNPLYVYTTFCLSLHPPRNMWVASTFWLCWRTCYVNGHANISGRLSFFFLFYLLVYIQMFDCIIWLSFLILREILYDFSKWLYHFASFQQCKTVPFYRHNSQYMFFSLSFEPL